MDLASLRSEYARASLDEHSVDDDPYAQFGKWFDEVLASQLPMPNAMNLASVDASGAPHSRMVLLKDFDLRGMVFYTNTRSHKGRELATNPSAALLFFWAELERQVRIEGRVAAVTAAEADAYFRSRPLGARLGAWASPQSQVLPDRAALETHFAEASRRYGDDPPRPPHWSGYRVLPHVFEFWQGRPSRLHDRVRYCGTIPGAPPAAGERWIIERLAP